MSIHYGFATKKEELKGILQLQARNLPEQLTEEQRIKEGFLTVKHDYAILEKMNNKCPHIIAKDGDKVVGYTLCMHPDFSKDIPILRSMFKQLETSFRDKSYIIMGQVCVDQNYRGQGIFRGLYKTMKQAVEKTFDAIVTEVDGRNIRSLNAHLAVGFQLIKKYQSDGRDWYLIAL